MNECPLCWAREGISGNLMLRPGQRVECERCGWEFEKAVLCAGIGGETLLSAEPAQIRTREVWVPVEVPHSAGPHPVGRGLELVMRLWRETLKASAGEVDWDIAAYPESDTAVLKIRIFVDNGTKVELKRMFFVRDMVLGREFIEHQARRACDDVREFLRNAGFRNGAGV